MLHASGQNTFITSLLHTHLALAGTLLIVIIVTSKYQLPLLFDSGLHTCRFTEAVESDQVAEANAVCIATATLQGRPSNRMVLMKGYDERGFIFFSNYSSRKGQELQQNALASLCFWWEPLHRSVTPPQLLASQTITVMALASALMFITMCCGVSKAHSHTFHLVWSKLDGLAWRQLATPVLGWSGGV